MRHTTYNESNPQLAPWAHNIPFFPPVVNSTSIKYWIYIFIVFQTHFGFEFYFKFTWAFHLFKKSWVLSSIPNIEVYFQLPLVFHLQFFKFHFKLFGFPHQFQTVKFIFNSLWFSILQKFEFQIQFFQLYSK